MSLDNVNVIFCSWLFPWVSPSPGSSLRCAWAVDGSHEQHLAVPPQWGSACAGGHLSSQYVPPCRAALLSLFPTCPDAGCGWPCSSSSKRICRLHHLNMNQLCDVAGIYWMCISSRSVISTVIHCSCPRVSLIPVFLICFLKNPLNSNSVVQPVYIPPQPCITCTLTRHTSYSLSQTVN